MCDSRRILTNVLGEDGHEYRNAYVLANDLAGRRVSSAETCSGWRYKKQTISTNNLFRIIWLLFAANMPSDYDSDPSDDTVHIASVHTSSSSKHNENPTVKRTVKYLAICNGPRAVRESVRASTDGVAKCICHTAHNAERGDAVLSLKHKTSLGKHRKLTAKLMSHAGSLQTKRKVLHSRKGGFIISALIRIAAAALGDQLFSAIKYVIVSESDGDGRTKCTSADAGD